MDYASFLAYLGDYLHSTDPKVQANLQTFGMLGASRIGSEFRGSVLEVVATLAPAAAVMLLPAGVFLGVRVLTVNGRPAKWISLQQLRELQRAATDAGDPTAQGMQPELVYALYAGGVELFPAPASTDAVVMTHLQLSLTAPDVLTESLPHLMLRAAAAEANLYQGDNEAAGVESALFAAGMRATQGWDFNGSLSLGGVR